MMITPPRTADVMEKPMNTPAKALLDRVLSALLAGMPSTPVMHIHMPIHIPKYALPVQPQKLINSTRQSLMPKHISKNPIKMCAIARFLAILATLAEGSAVLALLALVLSLRIFCTNKELLT